MSEVIAEATKSFLARGKERSLVWKTSLTSAVKDEGFLDRNSQEFCTLLFETLPYYHSQADRRAVQKVVQLAVHNDTFVKTLAGALVKHVAGSKPSRHEAFALVQWSCALLGQLNPETAKKAVAKVVEITGQLLDVLLASGLSWSKASLGFVGLLVTKLALQPEFLDVAVATCSPGLLRLVQDFCSTHGAKAPEYSAAVKEKLLAVYVEKVLNAKDRPGPVLLGSFPYLLGSLTPEEFQAKILPAIMRTLKRTPEAVMTTLTALLQQVHLDMSPYASDLFPVLLQQIRLKESVRQLAVDAVAALARRMSDVGVLGSLTSSTIKILDGSAEGKIKNQQERLALLSALSALCEAPGEAAEFAELATRTSNSIAAYYKDEVGEDVRLTLLQCLALWVVRCGGPAPPTVAALLSAGLKESKETLRRGHLRCVGSIARGGAAARPGLAGCADALSKLVMEGVAKATQRGEGAAALMAAALIAAADTNADSLLDKDKVWAGAIKADSPLLSAAVTVKLPPAECLALAHLPEALLLGHPARLQKHEGALEAVCRLMTALQLHYAKDVRKAAGVHAATCVAASPQLLGPLLDALRSWMDVSPAIPSVLDPTSDEPVLTGGHAAGRFQQALRALLPRAGAELPAEQMARALLAAHHPAATVGCRRHDMVWRALRERSKYLDKVSPASAPSIAEFLAGPQGLQSTTAAERCAAQSALGSCMALAPTHFFQPILQVLEPILDRTEHDALTEEDIAVYNTPEGILSADYQQKLEGVYVPEVVADKNVRKARGRMRVGSNAFGAPSDDSDDEPVAAKKPAAPPAPRPSAANGTAAGGRGAGRASAAGGKKDAAVRQQEHKEQQLAKEAANRQRIRQLRDRLLLGLQTLQSVALGNKRFTGDNLAELMPLCLPLMSSPLVGQGAFEAVRALASCLPASLGAKGLSLTASLRLVVLASSGRDGAAAATLATREPIVDVVNALCKVTANRRALPASAYNLVFPVLEAILGCRQYTALHEPVLGVLALHVAPGEAIPRAASLKLLYHLLEVVPAYRDRVQPLLKSLCSGVSDEAEMLAAMKGLLSPSALVRAACLAALPAVPAIAEGVWPPDADELSAIMLLAQHDVNEANADVAANVSEMSNCELEETYVGPLVRHLASPHDDVRTAAAAALCTAMGLHTSTKGAVLQGIVASYTMVAAEHARRGVALGLKSCAAEFAEEDVPLAMDFLISNGLADESDKVREEMVAAGVAIVDARGATHYSTMMPLFEGYLDKGQRAPGGAEAHQDLVREGVVVFLGTLARHLDAADPKRKEVISTLVEVLGTPSEAVQRAVANCVPPLVQPLGNDKEYLEELIKRLLDRLTNGATYGDRRGAAYGLAGTVKGLGISSLKNFAVLDQLKTAIESKDPKFREGALLAFECLCDRLGRLFEPYVIHILPMLLQAFGDAVPMVRSAADDTARSIMANLTASGVKLVLPALLRGLEDKVWRTKQGSVQLLGAMAHCAPKQLGVALPTIVPRLAEVLTDPHPKVQSAAQEALNEVGSVIANPEIKALVPSLLAAISDPNTSTKACLDVLLATVFVNTIDAPSLALIVPVVHRGLRDRSGDIKKRAAKIVGSMCSLVNDPKDMGPYVGLLMPEVQKSLVDPLPEVRAIAARALGSLLQGMGQEHFADLLPWLKDTLKSDASSVERSGAAQGLAEVLAVLGPEQLTNLLPDLLASVTSRNAYIREGHLTLFRFLPLTMEGALHRHLPAILPVILDGLSDESEGVRDAALAAGRTMVDMYAQSAMKLLLPAVEEGVFADNWRIRQSSVELLGELLFKVAGTSGKVVLDGGSDDEGAATEHYGSAILDALGRERRDDVLARIYVLRSDTQYSVRHAAVHVWKSVVVNTPKTMGEILPVLMQHVIESLAHEGEDRKQMAARCLGELVRKMGERVLSKVIPILRDGMSKPESATRQGVCLGLREVLEGLTKQQVAEYLPDILPPVQAALCDADPEVREAAGGAFNLLFKGGAGGVDSVVPSMLTGLEAESAEKQAQSLEGLRVILSVRPQVFHSIVARLLKPPTVNGVRALGELAEVAGQALHAHIGVLLSTLLTLASVPGGGALAQAAGEAVLKIALAVEEDDMHLLVPELLKGLEEPSKRRGSAQLVRGYAQRAEPEPLQDHIPSLINALVVLFAEEDESVLLLCWSALEAVLATVPKESHPAFVRPLKDAIAGARDKERRKRKKGPLLVAGFCVPPKALAPVLPIFLAGVLQGSSPEMREMAAEGLGELVDVTGEEALRPFVVQITGPLIRIIGDRFPSQIKAAILVTLGLLIGKAGAGLKPFVPQLQTTFLKCLHDPADNVRKYAATNLGQLSKMSVRVDQLATDLVASALSPTDPQITEAFLMALRGVLLASGERVTPASITKVGDGLLDLLRSIGDSEEARVALATACGAYCRYCSAEELKAVLVAGPLGPQTSSWLDRQLHAMLLASAAQNAPERLEQGGLQKPVAEAVVRYSRDDKIPVKVASGRAAGRLLALQAALAPSMVNVLVALLGPDQSSEVQRQALLAVKRCAVAAPAAVEPYISSLVPSMCSLLADVAGPVKAACERALAKVLQAEAGPETAQKYLATGPGGLVRTTLTEAFLRRLQKLPEEDDLFDTEDF